MDERKNKQMSKTELLVALARRRAKRLGLLDKPLTFPDHRSAMVWRANATKLQTA